jgi:4-hydroxybenzoate polyprenyltransferase
MSAGIAGSIPAGGARGRQPRRWLAIVLVVVPCLLALAAALYGMLLSFLIGISSCFDTCAYQNWLDTSRRAGTILVVELALGVTAFAVLIAGLVAPRRRQALGLTGWILFLLAATAAVLMAFAS